MHPFIKRPEPQQAGGTRQRQRGARENEKCHKKRGPARQFGDGDHSITSPRMRNFASATVPAKPSNAITSAASK